MLTRVLEPEIMDSPADAREYDAMNNSALNPQFLSDLVEIMTNHSQNVLALGPATAKIPIELARRAAHAHITAVDAAPSMLTIARANVAAANVTNRVVPVLADAKHLPFTD